jgi:leucyl aminopeptidase
MDNMKITFATKDMDDAPKGVVRVRFAEEVPGGKRLVRENEVDWLEIQTGKGSEMNRRKFIIVCRAIIQAAKTNKIREIAIQLDRYADCFAGFKNDPSLIPEEVSQIAAENFEMANFEFNTFKTKPKEGWNYVDEVFIYGAFINKETAARAKKGQLIGQMVNATRELANTPGGSMTPRGLANAAKAVVKGIDTVTVKTLGRKEIEALGMGALAGVGAGSSNEPTFTIMQYKGGKVGDKPIVLAGKGITFDSGGLNLKPSAYIYEMHMDMSGAAAVMHTVALAAKLKLKKNVIGLIPAAENMPGNNATRPGDVLKSLSGKTIEVTNTDAEGRLVLADAITYAKRFKPAVIIDVATLTGAALVALGLYASGVLTRDEKLSAQLSELGEKSGDYVWPLPMWDEYEMLVKSDFADVVNSSMQPGGKYGGTIEGGMFLWQFAKELDCPWAHIDMAPRMTAAPGDELAKGAAGAPVRLLLSFIESWTN